MNARTTMVLHGAAMITDFASSAADPAGEALIRDLIDGGGAVPGDAFNLLRVLLQLRASDHNVRLAKRSVRAVWNADFEQIGQLQRISPRELERGDLVAWRITGRSPFPGIAGSGIVTDTRGRSAVVLPRGSDFPRGVAADTLYLVRRAPSW